MNLCQLSFNDKNDELLLDNNFFIKENENKEKEKEYKEIINHNYVKLENYRGHLNTDPNFIDFGEINEYSLCGIILKISNIDDNDLTKLFKICDSINECIGFTIHPTVGILFYNHTTFPLQYVRNWNFYIKNSENNKKYEMNIFINKRINYNMSLISSSLIPSLSLLNIKYSIPIIPRKFISFEWNVGRTNNQLYSFEAMIQYCVIYIDRTIILPFTTHRNHELGMMKNQSLSIWDMIKFSEICDFIFEYEITQNTLPNDLKLYIQQSNDINYDKNTFDININKDDIKWRNILLNNNNNDNNINEPNWNLLSLLEFRQFTNNNHWTLSHENLIHNNWNDNEWKCYVSRGIRDGIPHKSLTECRLIQFCLGRYAHFKLDDWPIFNVLKFIIPSLRIRHAVNNTILYWFEQNKYYRIGVHRRAMKEGGKDSSGSPYVCRFKSKSLSKSGRYLPLKRHIENIINNKEKVDGITDLYDRTCAINFDTIQEILKFHKQNELLKDIFWDNKIIDYKKRKKNKEPWFLACDNQEKEILLELINKYGAFTLNGKSLSDFWNGPLYWNKANLMEIEQRSFTKLIEKQYLKYLKIFTNFEELKKEKNEWLKIINDKHKSRWWYDMSKIEFWRKETVVFDMWMLKNSKFFIGSWHSTLTRNVCHWRGFENMYNSTNCYLSHKWRKTTNTNTNNNNDWFDIDVIDKPKLLWQDGK